MLDRKEAARILYKLPTSDYKTALLFLEALQNKEEPKSADFFSFIGWNPHDENTGKMNAAIIARANGYKFLKDYGKV